MLSYYGYTLSPNQIETVEGFLICRNVPIARTGTMQYLACELGLEGNEWVTVSRSPEEVFSAAALSSFEGKPVTDEHPPDLIRSDSYVLYAKGHAQNIRKGEGEWEGHVLADLHIQDEALIREIQGGKREISCGYECNYVKEEDGSYSQHQIRGNHVAVVACGRAGERVAILDSEAMKQQKAKKPERKNMGKKNVFLKLFGRAVKDATPEELEELAADAAEALEEKPTQNATPPQEDAAGLTTDEMLKKILDAITNQKQSSQTEVEEKKEEEEALDKAIKELSSEEEGEQEEKEKENPAVVQADARPTRNVPGKELWLDILKAIRPAVSAIKDPTERKRVSDSLLSCMPKGEKTDTDRLLAAVQHNAQAAVDTKPSVDLDACQAAYDAMNPHKKGADKNAR